MTEAPAQTLRRAAEKLRRLAKDAEPSPWRVELRDGDVDVLGPSPYWIGSFGHEATAQAHRDGAYVAAMHPGVALAVADWLDAEADCHEGATAVSEAACALAENAGAGQHRVMVAASTLDQALAAARALLGEDPATAQDAAP